MAAEDYDLFIVNAKGAGNNPNGAVDRVSVFDKDGNKIQILKSGGYVTHGVIPNTPRPLTTSPVTWVGISAPLNAQNNDSWIDGPSFSVLLNGSWRQMSTTLKYVPQTMAGLKAWWRADDITGLVSGDAISTWSDTSGNNNHLAATSTARPTWQEAGMNGRACARFDGSNDRMTLTFPSELVQPTTFVIVYRVGVLKNTILFDGITALKRNWLGTAGSPFNQTLFSSAVVASSTPFTTTPSISVATFNGTTCKLRTNGVNVLTAANSGGYGLTGLTIGGEYSGSATYFLNGDIAEILVFSSALSAGDITVTEQSLAAYYGITLP